jgi:hypothetical protein
MTKTANVQIPFRVDGEKTWPVLIFLNRSHPVVSAVKQNAVFPSKTAQALL